MRFVYEKNTVAIKIAICGVLAVLFCATFSACNKNNSKNIESESEGKIDNYPVNVFSVDFEKTPAKIAVLNPALVEMVFDLGYGDRIVAVGENCAEIGSEHSGKLEKIPLCGSVLEPDIDKLKALGVELVFAHSEFDGETASKLSSANIANIAIAPASSLSMIKEQCINLGKVFAGKTTGATQGEENYKKIEAEISYIESILADRSVNKAVTGIYLAEKDNIIATPDTLLGEMFSKIGVKNLADSSQDAKNWNMADLDDKLDLIEVIFCPVDLVDTIKKSSFYSECPAVKNNYVFGIDGKTMERKGMSFFKACGSMANMLKSYVYPATETTTTTAAVATT